MTISNKTML